MRQEIPNYGELYVNCQKYKQKLNSVINANDRLGANKNCDTNKM